MVTHRSIRKKRNRKKVVREGYVRYCNACVAFAASCTLLAIGANSWWISRRFISSTSYDSSAETIESAVKDSRIDRYRSVTKEDSQLPEDHIQPAPQIFSAPSSDPPLPSSWEHLPLQSMSNRPTKPATLLAALPTKSFVGPALNGTSTRRAETKEARMSWEYQNIPIPDQPPVIVGGTDGSGTRGAVTFLLSSGVLMLNDAGGAGDCQYDVHGKELHPSGWPPVVQRVLGDAHSADYDPQIDLSAAVYRETLSALRSMAQKFRKRVARELSARGEGQRSMIRWGFKAPVTMFMVPFWAEVFPGATFLHVVRDGRDMTFHWLQSPVRRYWRHIFPEQFRLLPLAEQQERSLIPERGSYIGRAYLYDEKGQRGGLNKRPHFRIAELWSESNMQVEAAGRRLAARTQDKEPKIKFLTVRSEDFVTTRDRYFGVSTALMRTIQIDSHQMSDHAMCCLVLSHWKAEQQSSGWAKHIQNYGKWKGAVNAYGGEESAGEHSSLYGGILKRSRKALEYFGYIGQKVSTWNYSDVGGIDCSAFMSLTCRPEHAHKQKCM